MPYVTGEAAPVVARINELLFLSLTGMPAPQRPAATFTLADTTDLQGTASIDFEVRRNDGQVLTLAIKGEYCGASSCEGFVRAFNFDVHTGRALKIEFLFTPEGTVQIEQRMRKERLRRYTEQIKLLKSQRARRHDTKDRIRLNKHCIQQERTAPEALVGHYEMWVLTNGAITFTSARCSSYTEQELDDVGEVTLNLPLEGFGAMLTEYGKALLRGDSSVRAIEHPFGNVVRGKVGTSPITMWLEDAGGREHISGSYFYDKYRTPIALHGRMKGTEFELVENTGKPDQATFSLTASDGGLKGSWTRQGKQLSVDLQF